jgi:DNA-binding IclR family transcriptional regulator
MAKSPNYRAPALEKGLDILELIASQTRPLSLSEVSERLGKSKSEIFRMIMVLEERGYIVRDDKGEGYSITNRLFMLSMAQPPVRTLLDIALPQMRLVADQVWQSCHLVVASEDEIVVIARVNSPGDIGYAVHIGHKRPVDRSASGPVLFAFQPEAVRDAWLKRLRKKRDFDEADFLARVKRVRADGYARVRSQRVPSVTDISVPLFEDERAIATITIPYVEQVPATATADVAVAELQKAAREISRSLDLNSSPVIMPGTPSAAIKRRK